ncbi:MAG: hypothetical protein GKR93_19590 [Gammaproteobacteria bacterium]|nr:hypothetical protein [Gammaproteobacteria bacterium]
MNNYFDIRLRSLFLISCVSMLSPLFLQAAGYETFSPENSDFLKNQNLSLNVRNDGFINHYQLLTEDSAQSNVASNEFAQERLHELDIIKAIGEIKQTDAFMKGFQASVDTTMKAAEQALNDPEKAVKNLEKGFSRFLDNVGATVSEYSKGVTKDSGTKTSDKSMIKQYLGVYSEKRKLAVEFGVDPYSSNEVLQKHLEDLSMAVVAGGASLDVALQSAPGAASAVRKTASMMQEGAQHYLLASPKILKFKINEHLSDNNFPAAKIEELLNTSQCSLRHAVTVAGVLTSIELPELNKELFSWALDADDENECRRRMHMMELAWDYKRRKKINTLWISNDQLYWRDTGDNEVVAIVADNLLWTAELEKLLDELQSIYKAARVSGNVSDKAKSEIGNRGISLSANRFSRMKGRQNIGNNIFGGSELPELEQLPVTDTVVAPQTTIPVPEIVEGIPEEEELVQVPIKETIIDVQIQSPVSDPIEETTKKENAALEQVAEEETIVAVQEQISVSEPLEDPVQVLSPVIESEPESEPVKEKIVNKPECWEHSKLGKFIFTTENGQVKLTHDIVSKNELRHFKLTIVGKQYFWKASNLQHAFTKYKGEMTLSTNIYKNKNDIPLSKCKDTN